MNHGPSSRSPFQLAPLVFACMSFSACVVGPDYVRPEIPVPDAWHRKLSDGLETGDAPLHAWWTVLNDAKLTELIERAAAGNKDLKVAFARVQEVRAMLGIATSERFPTVGASGRSARFGLSEDLLPGSSGDRLRSLEFTAAWEIDLWGRVTRSIESAVAGLQATVENYRDVLVLLYAEIANSYLELRSLQARIRYAEANVELQRQTLGLTNDRFAAQISSELDVRQAELNVERTAALIPQLRAQSQRAVHRIAVLLGEHPGALQAELATDAAIPTPPERARVTFPADLVRQRPDLRRAERELAAQTARIGVATAMLYPQFSLFGSFGWDSSSGSLFSPAKESWGFAPSFEWALFDGGRVRNDIEAEKARTEQALAFYEQTVLLALEEVENALVAYTEEIARRDRLQASVDAAERSVELVGTLYRTGLTDFQNVLDMQRSLVQQQDELGASRGRVAQSLVLIYKALGGGWQPAPGPGPDDTGRSE